ncbi:MAG TPA: acetamidase/formamidase family protein [Bacteroidales bacterium]|nr:acetamidase/formamidase family protein [Bacteroidales bacterium]
MNRSIFIKRMMVAPAFATGFSAGWLQTFQTSGIRRLSADSRFTVWKPQMKAAYHVGLDEVVLVEMSHGMPGLVTRDGVFRESGPDSIINPQTGPIFIDGIESGDSLAIDILDIKTGEWGYCSGKIFELRDGYAEFSESLRLPLEPMLGCLGVAPVEGVVDTRAPGETGGNMDCREVRAGSTVVFRSNVKGALVGMGDAHALQGDGEVTGQGIETDAEAIIRFRRLPEVLSDRPVIIREDSFSTLGADKDLENAAWQATEDMINLLQKKTGRSRNDARLLVGLTGKLKINQIVDPTKGARMEVPSWVFGI